MPYKGWKTITVKDEVYDYFQGRWLKEKDEYREQGITSFSGFVTKLLFEMIKQEEFPHLRHINTYENRVIIGDRRTDSIVLVYLREDGVAWCDKDEEKNCDHVKFALSLPQVQEAYRRKGLKIPET